MHNRFVQFSVLSFTLLVATTAFCQGEIIVKEKPLKSQTLSGTVLLGDSPEGVKGVLVERCTANWRTVKTSMHTNKDGRFSFRNAPKKEVHYLRLSFPGAHPLQIKVKITRSGPKELVLVLSFAT